VPTSTSGGFFSVVFPRFDQHLELKMEERGIDEKDVDLYYIKKKKGLR
jgi:hypothetical protein